MTLQLVNHVSEGEKNQDAVKWWNQHLAGRVAADCEQVTYSHITMSQELISLLKMNLACLKKKEKRPCYYNARLVTVHEFTTFPYKCEFIGIRATAPPWGEKS